MQFLWKISLFSRLKLFLSQVAIAQLAGIILLWTPSSILGDQFAAHAKLAYPVLFLSVVYFIVVLRELLLRKSLPPAAKLFDRLHFHLWWLLVSDLTIIYLAIGASGGIRSSHLVFVLLLIPSVVALVATPGVVLSVITVIIALLIFAEVGLPLLVRIDNSSNPSTLFAALASQAIQWTLGIQFPLLEADKHILFPRAYAVALIISILLSLVQALASSLPVLDYSLSDALWYQMIEWPRRYSLPYIEPYRLSFFHAQIRRAFSFMGRRIKATNEPLIHRSMVHPFFDTMNQACILALPGLLEDDEKACIRVAAMTIGIHWLDDLFDSENYGAELAKNGGIVSFEDLCDYLRPTRVDRVARQVVKLARWKAGAKSGLLRVCLAGMLKHATGGEGMIETRYCNLLTEGIPADIVSEVEQWPLVLKWALGKTAMPLVCSMYWKEKDVPDLAMKCLILDAVFAPLMLWHDLEEERYRGETILRGKSEQEWQRQLRSCLRAATCFIEEHGAFLQGDARARGMTSPVVRIVWDTHSKRLPNWAERDSYEKALRKLDLLR